MLWTAKQALEGLAMMQNRWDLADGVVWKSTGLMESWDQGRSWWVLHSLMTVDCSIC